MKLLMRTDRTLVCPENGNDAQIGTFVISAGPNAVPRLPLGTSGQAKYFICLPFYTRTMARRNDLSLSETSGMFVIVIVAVEKRLCVSRFFFFNLVFTHDLRWKAK